MREIRYNTRTFLNAKNQVVIRVRWNNKKSEVGFSIGMTVDPMKWDSDTQRPIRASTHTLWGTIEFLRESSMREYKNSLRPLMKYFQNMR